MYPIIDTHTHFYDPARPQGVPWPRADDKVLYRTVLPADFKQAALPAGVTGTVVVEASPWLEDNQWILDLAVEDPFILGLVGHIAPGRPAFAAELQRFAANPLLRGIRCGGRTFAQVDAALLRDLEQLAKHDLQLDVLLGLDQMPAFLAVAAQLPELRIVINHISLMPVTGKALESHWIEHYQQAAALPNIFMKVSGLMENSVIRPAPVDPDFYRPTLDALWSAFGAQRLIYGSNWPVCEIAGTYATCSAIVRQYFDEKGEQAAASFFGQNAQRAYGLL
jgi:L-fuconolactonase